jgi:flagellar basal body-associated protein FliL
MMVGKAELDKMDLPAAPEEVPPPETPEESSEAVVEIPPGWLASRGRQYKWGLFGLIGFLVVAGFGYGIWSTVAYFQERKAALAREKNAAAQVLAAVEASRMVFRDFLIPLPEGDRYRILAINFVAEMDRNRKQSNLNVNAGVRRQVMNAIQMRGNELLASVQNREQLKKDLVSLLNQVLGEGAVKNVYLMDLTFI